MKNVLFLTDAWEPFPTANVACLQNVLSSMDQKKFAFHINAFGITPQDTHITKDGVSLTIIKTSLARNLFYQADYERNAQKSKLKRRIARIISNARRLFYLPIYPKTWSFFEQKWYTAALEEIKEQNIEAIVSVVAPMEALWVGEKIKKAFPDLEWIIYLIDGGSDLNEGESYSFIKKHLQYMAMKKMRAAYQLADDVIIMQCHEKHYKQPFFDEVAYKLHILDVPLLSLKKKKAKSGSGLCQDNKPVENWVYAGSLDTHYYDPQNLCDFFHEYCKTKKAVLHFYGRGSGTEVLESIIKQRRGEVVYHGLLKPTQLPEVYQNADVLVNYLSAPMSSVSGKFFEYVTYGKPVVYFSPLVKDVNTSYVERYPLGVCLLPNETLDQKVEKVTTTVKKAKEESVDSKTIVREFWNSTPQATASVFEQCLNKLYI